MVKKRKYIILIAMEMKFPMKLKIFHQKSVVNQRNLERNMKKLLVKIGTNMEIVNVECILYFLLCKFLKGTPHATFEKHRVPDSKMTELRKKFFNSQ